jgi:hypothetical protein
MEYWSTGVLARNKKISAVYGFSITPLLQHSNSSLIGDGDLKGGIL